MGFISTFSDFLNILRIPKSKLKNPFFFGCTEGSVALSITVALVGFEVSSDFVFRENNPSKIDFRSSCPTPLMPSIEFSNILYGNVALLAPPVINLGVSSSCIVLRLACFKVYLIFLYPSCLSIAFLNALNTSTPSNLYKSK